MLSMTEYGFPLLVMNAVLLAVAVVATAEDMELFS